MFFFYRVVDFHQCCCAPPSSEQFEMREIVEMKLKLSSNFIDSYYILVSTEEFKENNVKWEEAN